MFEGKQLATADLAVLQGALSRLDPDVDAAERIDRIRLLERLKGALAAAQLAETAAFAAAQRDQAIAAGVPAEHAERGVAAQLALARRMPPHRAARELGWARILIGELPATFAALHHGDTTEWRALLVARETAWLSRTHRLAVDDEIAPRLEGLSDRGVERQARRIAYRLDPVGAAARLGAAAADRRVTVRPAPDSMTRLTALLPVQQGVACYAALLSCADTARAAGDSRTRGQVMADTLVKRVTGQARADDQPVEINLIMTDRTLFAGGADAAQLEGGEPLPAPIARALALQTPDPAGAESGGRSTPRAAQRWIRLLIRHPDTGALAAMESRRRCFTPAQRAFVGMRDQVCRTPWCEAPIRHTDHVLPYAQGGSTSVGNAAGLCEACNHAKQAPGWSTRPSPVDPSEILITTPTGHQYVSRSPDPPGAGPPR